MIKVELIKKTTVQGKVLYLLLYDGFCEEVFLEDEYEQAQKAFSVAIKNEANGLPKVEVIASGDQEKPQL